MDANGEKKRNRPFDIEETRHIRDHLLADARDYGTFLYVEIIHRYLRIFVIHDRMPRDIIKDAVFCILFIGIWRKDIKLRQLYNKGRLGPKIANLLQNFMTSQTATDVLITCNQIVLLSILFNKEFPNVNIDVSRMSSRFSEYVFQVWHTNISCCHILVAWQCQNVCAESEECNKDE